mmetsp:Transcript_39591/g.95639  ORF Transcript_39591/g.95639 Transcript_39591/m.95639 type:complete len:169 (+) Transcript_39591:191-697(+)|eukprot:CAMPEP_0113471036 /NCGR_PEP_ID=MMETSP0014_2-20120614/16769_1 /TAXON_ID=2857 /ORGANISM="Nitzschia sp." /LENGTH=168 /DNA_ID=CAMNT_0000363655 /DNA_START=101 /DNA_END=607 /DNA_ORIENTATION=- /assembly_acc=CAM_ASM_000159
MSDVEQIVIVHGGELAKDVAEQIEAKKPEGFHRTTVVLRSASERPKTIVEDYDSKTVVCFVFQTIENGAPTEEGGSCTRFFQRKTHPADLLSASKNKFSFTVLGVGDSNLLLDRQTTTAKDCNQVAQALDCRLEALGAKRHHPLGLADERTGLQEVEPWIESFWQSVA